MPTVNLNGNRWLNVNDISCRKYTVKHKRLVDHTHIIVWTYWLCQNRIKQWFRSELRISIVCTAVGESSRAPTSEPDDTDAPYRSYHVCNSNSFHKLASAVVQVVGFVRECVPSWLHPQPHKLVSGPSSPSRRLRSSERRWELWSYSHARENEIVLLLISPTDCKSPIPSSFSRETRVYVCARIRDIVYEPPVLMRVAEATSRIPFVSCIRVDRC